MLILPCHPGPRPRPPGRRSPAGWPRRHPARWRRLWQGPRCAIGFRQFSSGDVHAPTATVTLTKPAGAAGDDVLVAVLGGGQNGSACGSWTAPAGWTAVGSILDQTGSGGGHISLQVFCALGSVASPAFTKSGNVGDLGWVVLAFTGVDNTTPVDATGTANANSAAASITANAVTVATDQAWHVIGLTSWIGGTWSATGFTMKQNAGSNEDGSCGYNPTPKSVGSTGTVSCGTTGGATNQVLAAVPFALRPAAGAAADNLPWLAPTRVEYEYVDRF